MTEDRKQMTEDRKQMTEDRKQKTEDRKQKNDVRGLIGGFRLQLIRRPKKMADGPKPETLRS